VANSTIGKRKAKPSKPYADFPLFPHATGRWAKKIRGRLHYFGKWDDWEAALEKYQREAPYLHAGRMPPETFDGITVADLCNRFLTAKQQQLDSGELAPTTFRDYHRACQFVVGSFGKGRLVDDLASGDFEALRAELAKQYGPVRLGTTVQMIRTAFRFAYDSGMLDKPVRFGPMFKKPSKRTLRVERQKKGPKMFEAAEIRALLQAANQPLHAMILLGVNCGFGNHDCSTLPQSAIDFERGWVDHPRPKTGIERRCPLWPETSSAMQDAISIRPKPRLAEHDRLVFLTRFGTTWTKTDDNTLAKEFRKLLGKLKLHRPGLGFYALRHTFETIAGESRDQVAVSHIMGHVHTSMSAHYRERISDERLRDCVEHVRVWLFGKEGGAE